VQVGKPTAPERGAAWDVTVWQVDLLQPTGWIQEATVSLLASDERERVSRGTPEVRRRRLVARAALRIALSRSLACPPWSLRLVQGPNGKPALATPGAGAELHFSLSRSGDCCLIATTTTGPIGVDVERVAAFPQLEEIVLGRFAPPEAAAIARFGGERRLRAFYNCWTRKEAYLKARGIGLTAPLDRIAVTVEDERPAILSLDDDDPDAWTLAAVDPGPGLVAALALRSTSERPLATLETSALPLDLEPSWTRSSPNGGRAR
jgi:4'-phosphopantetheinyl transferase